MATAVKLSGSPPVFVTTTNSVSECPMCTVPKLSALGLTENAAGDGGGAGALIVTGTKLYSPSAVPCPLSQTAVTKAGPAAVFEGTVTVPAQLPPPLRKPACVAIGLPPESSSLTVTPCVPAGHGVVDAAENALPGAALPGDAVIVPFVTAAPPTPVRVTGKSLQEPPATGHSKRCS